MSLTQFGIDDGPHSMDGLRLCARDGNERVEAFIGRKVMDVWAESVEHRGGDPAGLSCSIGINSACETPAAKACASVRSDRAPRRFP